jgi:NADH-quinone oxidoreductase subunit H
MFGALIEYFIFPGFIFLALAGMAVSWLDRKVTARIQWRVGPPLLQPFYDIRKLFIKETMIPSGGNTWLFVSMPFIPVLAMIVVSNMIAAAYTTAGFNGDLIVIFYLLTLPALACILGATASANPLASVGASREMKLVMGYELPLLLSVAVAALKARSLSIGEIVSYQQSFGSTASSASGLIAFIIAIVCLQGKMGLVPFDIPEAESELADGTLIEYSGPLLALWKLGKMILLVIGPVFLITLFWAGGNPWTLIPKYLAVLTGAILLKNTNPRLRIDQALKFFWGVAAVLACAALVLLKLGH